MNRTILLNPGPVTLTERVRNAMVREDWCHREQEFGALTLANNARLESIYSEAGSAYAAVTLTGSGTAAVESMLASFAPATSTTLVVANGVYGERMLTMLQAMGRPVTSIVADWNAPIDLEELERLLRSDDTISHVLTVHHETTTGRLNAVGDVGKLCKQYGRALLLDAVSSFGAESVRFADWNLEALAATANKCLHGVPGISLVLAKKSSLETGRTDTGSVYLDLRRYYAAQRDGGFSPFTQAVQSAFALDAALDELAEAGGWEQRRARYCAVGDRIRQTLRELGVRTVLARADYSAVMFSYRMPGNRDYASLHDALKRVGFVIYAGQGRFSGGMFRIAHMGDIRNDDLDRLDDALMRFFADHR